MSRLLLAILLTFQPCITIAQEDFYELRTRICRQLAANEAPFAYQWGKDIAGIYKLPPSPTINDVYSAATATLDGYIELRAKQSMERRQSSEWRETVIGNAMVIVASELKRLVIESPDKKQWWYQDQLFQACTYPIK